jgi:DNA-binding NarL/FixJ family response regulator
MNLITGLSHSGAVGAAAHSEALRNSTIQVLWIGGDEQFARRLGNSQSKSQSQSQNTLSVTFSPEGLNPDLLPVHPTILVVESGHGESTRRALALIAHVQWLAHVRSIFLTPSDQAQDRVGGYQAGADSCLSKPVDDRLLLAVIQQKWDRLVGLPH